MSNRATFFVFTGLNLYAYYGNDPISYCDPSGHFAIRALIIGTVGIVLCGLITGGLNVASKSDSESALGAFVGGFIEGSISAIALVSTTYLATLPKPTLNDYRDEERIKSGKGRFIWDYLI